LLPVRSFTGIDPSELRMLAEAEIAGSRVEFGILVGSPRLWVTFPERIPPVLGYLTGHDSAGGAHSTETDHLEWARRSGRAARIKAEALAAWQAAQKECEG
jgi:hypothetical protein